MKIHLIAVLTALSTGTLVAELTLASPFTNNAVLQRDMPVPVWGTSDAGTTVTVNFAGQTRSTTADSDGTWKVQLAPLSSSHEPRPLVISNAKDPKIERTNILVGEVWICSGQSNMQMGHGGIPEIKALLSKAKNLRTFEVKRTVAMTEQNTLEGNWVETPPTSAVAFSFAYFLEKAGDVPVGIILSCWGSSSLEAWMPRDMTKTVPHFKTMMKEFDADIETKKKITTILEGKKPWSRPDDIFLRRQTNILYNAMIHPLIPYACRGLVWYQGERNTQSMHPMTGDIWYQRHSGMLQYGDTLKAWIQRYRQGWQRDDFHFLVVMLPGFGKSPEDPSNDSWAWMRESQLKAHDLPHTAVANTIDLGDVKNVHPKDKLPVGQRLALLAARDTLGQKIEAQGPVFNRVEVNGNKLIVHFDHAKELKTSDGKEPTAFWLADDSGNWIRANAELNGQTVILQTPELPKPLYVRYAFSGKPRVNLVNAAKLPTVPFRTDSFEP